MERKTKGQYSTAPQKSRSEVIAEKHYRHYGIRNWDMGWISESASITPHSIIMMNLRTLGTIRLLCIAC